MRFYIIWSALAICHSVGFNNARGFLVINSFEREYLSYVFASDVNFWIHVHMNFIIKIILSIQFKLKIILLFPHLQYRC